MSCLHGWIQFLFQGLKSNFAFNLRNISRDYSDALLMAETINNFYPKLIQLHNYPSTNSVKNKMANWKTLNAKALSKLGINLKNEDLNKLASGTPNTIECLLHQFKRLCDNEGLYANKPLSS